MVFLRQSACVTTFPASRTPATVASKIARIFIGSLNRQHRRSTGGFRFLVALEPVRDLLFRAKDLFVAAKSHHWSGQRMRLPDFLCAPRLFNAGQNVDEAHY